MFTDISEVFFASNVRAIVLTMYAANIPETSVNF
jgi:hypothetical protein